MGLLENYQQQYPEAFRPKAREPELGEGEYGFIVRFVIHLPGGMVRNAKEASYVLLGAVGVIIVLTLVVFFWGGSGPKIPSAQEALRDTPTMGLRQGAELQ
ncbi:MAG: hypothetical protein WAP52_01595 [Candidatus Sungiibacteriota bacterium]